MALINDMVLRSGSQDSVCQCVGYMSYSQLLDLSAEESCVIRHVENSNIKNHVMLVTSFLKDVARRVSCALYDTLHDKGCEPVVYMLKF